MLKQILCVRVGPVFRFPLLARRQSFCRMSTSIMSSFKANASSPGRLDMLGGVADYSGSLVLQVASSCLTTASVSLEPSAGAPSVRMSTTAFSEDDGSFSAPLSILMDPYTLELPVVCAFLKSLAAPKWAFYVFGSAAAFVKNAAWTVPPGHDLVISVTGNVPCSQGVSSSASVECAVLRALAELRSALTGDVENPTLLQLAHWGQEAENVVVGAPCGLMDQLASCLGDEGKVLPILCRPDSCEAPVALPRAVALVGWPSGVKHDVGASPYLVARTATFMGKKMAESLLGRTLKHASQLAVSELRREVLPALKAADKETITGRDFLAEYGGVDDPLSVVEEGRTYAVAASLTFPVEENFRCSVALSLLKALQGQTDAAVTKGLLTQIGEIMMQSHTGYSAIGLGSPATDTIVRELAALGPEHGIYGARVSGGGSGGTVVVLCDRDAVPTVQRLAEEITFDGVPFTKLIH